MICNIDYQMIQAKAELFDYRNGMTICFKFKNEKDNKFNVPRTDGSTTPDGRIIIPNTGMCMVGRYELRDCVSSMPDPHWSVLMGFKDPASGILKHKYVLIRDLCKHNKMPKIELYKYPNEDPKIAKLKDPYWRKSFEGYALTLDEWDDELSAIHDAASLIQDGYKSACLT